MEWNAWTTVFAVLYILHHGFELGLELFQDRHLRKRRDEVPVHLKGRVDIETIRKAVAYNRDKLKLGVVSRLLAVFGTWVMILFGFGFVDSLASEFGFGVLPTGLIFFGVIGAIGFVWDLPLECVSTFGIEEKHGFNRQTPRIFAMDKFKGVFVSLLLGIPLLSLVLWLMENGGSYWWLYAYCTVTVLQLLVAWVYPVLIMPLFNKFLPVDDDLAADVAALSDRVGFSLKSVVTMDGSRRSAHSNAFFVGLFGARRIVLYDTLIEKISRPQLIGVLAHELGHFKLGHLWRRLVMIVGFMLILFAALAWTARQPDAYAGLGFAAPSNYAALVLFSLLSSEVLSPFGWIGRYFSRRDEYAADRFAVDAVKNSGDLSDALIGLTKQNLASPGSFKLYRSYYNSHPALKFRLRALRKYAKEKGFPQETPSD
jgi:STE24 endopeptidase